MARTVDDSGRAWLATMGCLGAAFLSVRRNRSVEKALVLLWLLARSGRNVQRTTVVRRAVFCSLAVVAKKGDPCAARARGLHCNDGAHRFAVGIADSRSLDRCRYCFYSYINFSPA